MGYIYSITNKIDNKVYIGQTVRDLNQRWKEHFKNGSNCVYLKQALQKHGIDNFKFKLICITFDELLNNYEIQYINKYNSLVPNGNNLRNGGNNGRHNKETKQKISNSLKNRTDIIYAKPQLGKPLSEERKKKMSEKLKGRKLSDNSIKKMVESRRKYDILQYDLNGNYLNKFNSCLEAGLSVGASKSNICNCCNGKTKTSKGYIWKYEPIKK